MTVKEESEKVGLKLNIQKTKIMASSPITSWEIDGETVETVADFIFGGSKITADGDCSHEIKIRLLLGRKVMTNLDSIFKSRDITLPTNVHLVKAMVFLWSCMDVRVGLRRRLSAEELMLLNWKSWLKAQHSEIEDHGIQSHHFMANRWGNSGNKIRLYFWGGSKITADGDCSHKIKRRMLLGRKVMTNLDSILKSRDIIANKDTSSQGYGFSSSGCESWTIKKAKQQRVDGFWTVVLEKTWESLGLQGDPTSPLWRRSVLNIHWMLNIHSASLMLKLKLQNFGLQPPDGRTDSCEKTLMLGKTDGRRRGWQRMR